MKNEIKKLSAMVAAAVMTMNYASAFAAKATEMNVNYELDTSNVDIVDVDLQEEVTKSTDENSVARAIATDIVMSSIRIPNSTDMVSSGVVNNGVITYEVTLRAKVSNSGSNYANQSITWAVTDSSSNVELISSDSKTNSSGIAYATFHVRNLTSIHPQITCGGTTKTATINIGTIARYKSDFDITYYITALEDDYSGAKNISVAGLNGQYKQAFLDAVKMEGCGYDTNGNGIVYDGGYSYGSPITSSSTTPKAGQTIAVDPNYIPLANRSGWKRGYVTIDNFGNRIAEDVGGGIKRFHIDIYTGIGKKTMPSQNSTESVVFRGVNSWGSYGDASSSLSEDENDHKTSSQIENKNVWISEDGSIVGGVLEIDYSKPQSVTIGIRSQARSNTNIELSERVLNVVDMRFFDNAAVAVIGYVNPSLSSYQIFDLESATLIDEYWGFGFIENGDDVIFIQAPPHFSGKRGNCKIIHSSKGVIYESEDDITISGDLYIRGSSLYFTEVDVNTGESETNSLNLSFDAELADSEPYYE